jgi:hypothetical protein
LEVSVVPCEVERECIREFMALRKVDRGWEVWPDGMHAAAGHSPVVVGPSRKGDQPVVVDTSTVLERAQAHGLVNFRFSSERSEDQVQLSTFGARAQFD